jgi:hypothetical protein
MSSFYSILKPYLYAFLFFVVIWSLYASFGEDEEVDFLAGRSHYGSLLLSCEVEGLSIYIDEELVGVTSKQEQRFFLKTYGSFGRADHEVEIRQEIDERREYYFYQDFAFGLYIDVEENPVQRYALSLDPPEAKTYPPENLALWIRLKPEVRAQETGLLQSVKLKHNQAWKMAEDEDFYYVLTQADTDLSRKSNNEPSAGEFIEVYAKQNLELVAHKRLTGQRSYHEDSYIGIGVSGETLFISDRNLGLLRLDKKSLKWQRDFEPFHSPQGPLTGFAADRDYLVGVYGSNVLADDVLIPVYKDGNLLYLIDETKHYPDNIEEIHDYGDRNRVNAVTVHQGVLYALNWRGFVNAYNLEDGRFVGQISIIGYDDEYNYVTGTNIETAVIYQQRYLYIAIDYEGLLIYDTQTGTTRTIETLFPERKEYSELFDGEIDMTKATSIYKMVFYKHYLVFSEVNGRRNYVYVYDLNQGELVHSFAGHRGDITELFLDGDQLTGLSTEGLLYRWDLGILERNSRASEKTVL